ncbi:MAG TPA: SdiA-regulated domain-containing protein [Salinimicrobium sp.]|nr:SdiA-regulated domain-containing protein [Salinimicrobium sp.]
MRISPNKTVFLISTGLLITVAVLYMFFPEGQKISGTSQSSDSPVMIEQTWKLPDVLKEISAIDYLQGNRVAAVQDEKGSIYIYNLQTSRIENEIEFAPKGDFEGIAISGEDAYVLRADGTVFFIKDFLGQAKVSQIDTDFTAEQDTEGLMLDKKNNMLLISVKEKDPNSTTYKGIYALDLNTGKLDPEPVYKINLNDPVFKNIKEKEEGEGFRPSEIAIDPETGEVLVLSANPPNLLILTSEGAVKKLIPLSENLFPQPEGLTLDQNGRIYISNEGSPATIHQIKIK